MTWTDFLRYTKYIAVFYVAAFITAMVGIWVPPHVQWIWTGALIFLTAVASNVALGFYQYNHRGSLLYSKAKEQPDNPQVVTALSDSKELALSDRAAADLDIMLDDVALRAARRARGY